LANLLAGSGKGTPLCMAIDLGLKTIVESLLLANADPYTPLHSTQFTPTLEVMLVLCNFPACLNPSIALMHLMFGLRQCLSIRSRFLHSADIMPVAQLRNFRKGRIYNPTMDETIFHTFAMMLAMSAAVARTTKIRPASCDTSSLTSVSI